MIVQSYDLETHKLQPGLLAPPLVCGSTATRKEGGRLLSRAQALTVARELLTTPDVLITGANIAYDFGVLANEDETLLRLIFQAYEEERVYDIQIAQALDAIAGGHLFKDPETGKDLVNPKTGKKTNRYSLDTCVKLTLKRDDAKQNDFWRTRYAILEHVPMELWSYEAVQYPIDDANNTVEVAEVQLGREGGKQFRNLLDMGPQAYTAFCMHLGAMHGLRTDRERVEALAERVEESYKRTVAGFKALGFIRADDTEDGSAVKRAVARAYGATGTCTRCNGTGKVRRVTKVPCRGEKVKMRFQGCTRAMTQGIVSCATCKDTGEVDKLGNEVICAGKEGGCDGTGLDLSTSSVLPRTDKGGISTDRDTKLESGDEDLMAYADNEDERIRTTYLPWLREGLDQPINLRPNVLVASGRTSYDGLIQLVPRGGGVRNCFRARVGRVFGSTDYAALELCTLAQVCLWVVGKSVMADTINASKDPGFLHTAFAAQMVGISPEEMARRIKAKDKQAKGYRQAAKAANFGFPGGMGAAKLVLSKRKRSEGTTEGPDGRKYAGIRFCILVDGAQTCGEEKITEWNRRAIPPTCKRCVELVQHQLRPAYFNAWPEMKEYFDWVSYNVELNGELQCFGPVERVRGGLDFCNGANNGFQALAADGAKYALRQATREAYTDESSPLYLAETRFPMFVHDELFSEMLAEHAHLAGPRIAEVMCKSMRKYVPDVHVSAETAIMEFWDKDAEPVYEDGKLVLWRPKEK